MLGRGGKISKNPARIIVDSFSEIERIGFDIGSPGAKIDGPQILENQRVAIGAIQGAVECSRNRVEGVDPAIAIISDQQIASKISKTGRSKGEAPRRLQLAAGRKTARECAVRVEDIDVTAGLRGSVGIEQRVSHVELPTDELDVKWHVTGQSVWIGKVPRQTDRLEGG